MKYSIANNYNQNWHDDIFCVYWKTKLPTRTYVLSKKKILKYFSELDCITPFHMILLDNLSVITSLYFYADEDKLVINLNQNFKKISVEIKHDDINKLISKCMIPET